jgi:hypothetical protein
MNTIIGTGICKYSYSMLITVWKKKYLIWLKRDGVPSETIDFYDFVL